MCKCAGITASHEEEIQVCAVVVVDVCLFREVARGFTSVLLTMLVRGGPRGRVWGEGVGCLCVYAMCVLVCCAIAQTVGWVLPGL